MIITFKTLDRSKEVHKNSKEKGLVLGFMLRPAHGREILYAEKGDGTFLSTGVRDFSPNFASKNWTRVDAIPNEAEFIGHYYL